MKTINNRVLLLPLLTCESQMSVDVLRDLGRLDGPFVPDGLRPAHARLLANAGWSGTRLLLTRATHRQQTGDEDEESRRWQDGVLPRFRSIGPFCVRNRPFDTISARHRVH